MPKFQTDKLPNYFHDTIDYYINDDNNTLVACATLLQIHQSHDCRQYENFIPRKIQFSYVESVNHPKYLNIEKSLSNFIDVLANANKEELLHSLYQ